MMLHFTVVLVALSVMNGGVVSEANGAMQVAVSRYGDLQTDFTVRLETEDGTGMFE